MNAPLISILMPAFNAERYIEHAVNSVLHQTYRNWELLICDDSSQDSTVSIIKGFSDVRISVYHNKVNQGYLKTINFLLKKTKGDFITFLDADDWSHPERLERQVKEFSLNSALGICGTWAQYYNEKGTQKTLTKSPAIDHEEIKLKVHIRNQFCGASIMIRRTILEAVGGYREYFDRIGNEDYDWSSRVVEKYHAKNIPEYLYFVRQTSNSVTRKIKSERQLISHDLVKVLIKQRLNGGEDFIDQNDFLGLAKVEDELLLPYRKDKSLIYRKAADISWYNQNRRNYLGSCWLAIVNNPFKVISWKYFITCAFRLLTSTK